MKPVTLYSNSWCPFCRRAKMLLEHKGAHYTEIDIEADPQQRQIMLQRTGRTSVPQIFIGEFHVGGCDDLFALEQQNKLAELLAD